MSDAVVRLDPVPVDPRWRALHRGLRTLELARRFGTPLYASRTFAETRDRLESAFASVAGDPAHAPSIKATPRSRFIAFSRTRTGCDVWPVARAALRAGTGPERISLNGPMGTGRS
jgi:hypothetical protein